MRHRKGFSFLHKNKSTGQTLCPTLWFSQYIITLTQATTMIALLSPSKSLDYESEGFSPSKAPTFKSKTADLIEVLKKKKSGDIQKLMHISEKLAGLNYQRYQSFSNSYNKKNSKAAISAFVGDVYTGFDAGTLSQEDIDYAQDHIRILSGLYGVLRPLDKMQAYRLEMGTKLKTSLGSNLYEFWDDNVTKQINKDLRKINSDIVINLASHEYFKVIRKDLLKATIIDVSFREYRDGKLKFISFNAKKARGIMARHMVINRLDTVEELKGFNDDGYHYDAELSDEKTLAFVR